MNRDIGFLDWMDEENIQGLGITTVALMFGYALIFSSLFSVFDSVINVGLVLLIWFISFYTALLPFYIVWIVERRRVRKYLE